MVLYLSKMLYDYFLQFSKASGLVVNQEKSSVYFGGVYQEDKAKILEKLYFSHSELPFQYLDIPQELTELQFHNTRL